MERYFQESHKKSLIHPSSSPDRVGFFFVEKNYVHLTRGLSLHHTRWALFWAVKLYSLVLARLQKLLVKSLIPSLVLRRRH